MLFTRNVNINVRYIVSCNINQKRILASLKVKQTQTAGLFDLPVPCHLMPETLMLPNKVNVALT